MNDVQLSISNLERELRRVYGPGYEGSYWQMLVNSLKLLEAHKR